VQNYKVRTNNLKFLRLQIKAGLESISGFVVVKMSDCHIASMAIKLFILYLFKNYKTLNIMALEITDANFDEVVLKSDKPVLVDFWAEWCGPCRMVGPVVEEIAKEYGDKAVVGKVNVDTNPGISMKFGIRNIPALLFFKNGEIVDKQIGAVPKSVLADKLNKQLV
jgi:thioredoxin 1